MKLYFKTLKFKKINIHACFTPDNFLHAITLNEKMIVEQKKFFEWRNLERTKGFPINIPLLLPGSYSKLESLHDIQFDITQFFLG
jgi:hypothetical protein